MGYTHYFTAKKFTNKEWDEIISTVKTLYENMPEYSSSGSEYSEYQLKLSGCFKYEHPIFNNERIHFNGSNGLQRVKMYEGGWKDAISEDPMDLAHETFSLVKKGCIDSCKTARKPYDFMVQAVLIVAKCVAPTKITVTSDGDNDDWADAFKFVSQHFQHVNILQAYATKFDSLFGE